MKKEIAILIALVMTISAVIVYADSTTTTYDDVDDVYVTEDIIDTPSPPFNYEYLYAGDDFEYTHTIDPVCKNILLVTLEIGAWDVDSGAPHYQEDKVDADGDYLGYLTGANEVSSVSTFTVDPALLADGELEILLDIDSTGIGSKVKIEYSKLIVTWVPCLKVEKEIVNALYSPWEFVPIFTTAWWDLEITVENPIDGYDNPLNGIWVYDGIGAKLDLVIQDDGDGDYIFKIGGVEQPLAGDDDQYYGDESGPVYWRQANGKPVSEKKRCATNVWWDIGDLDDGDPAVTLEFRVTTITFEVGPKNHPTKDPKIKYAFTSTCHHELNDGPIGIYWFEDNMYCSIGDPVIVSVYDPTPGVDSDGDGFEDWDEVQVGTDPCDPEEYPLPPVAEFTWTGLVAQNVPKTFDASASYDPDGGDIALYEWDWDNDGTYDDSSTSSTMDHAFAIMGWHTVVLRVTDDEGDTGTVSHNVRVLGLTPAPI